MTQVIQLTSNATVSRNYTLYLIILYFWILVATPHYRFRFLEDIHFERIVMLLSWAILIFSNKVKIRLSRVTLLILLFYFWMLISYFFSPYQNFKMAQWWFENYWKLIVFYFLILFSINDIKDLFFIFAGFVVVLFLYQMHSWYDFLHGGSYVWQQGIKRISGVWGGGELGAANQFGMIALFSIPITFFWFNATKKRVSKFFLSFSFFMSFASIIYSGTRAAMVSLFFFIFLIIINRKQKNFKILILFSLLFLIILLVLPEGLKHRYFDLISDKEAETQNETASDKIARDSALSRLEGLQDGWELFLKRPVFGYGPGSSAIARSEINEVIAKRDDPLELHSLYGQVLSETGFIGTFLFLLIIIIYLYQLYSMKDIQKIDLEDLIDINNYKLLLQNFILLVLFYGFFSHTLYRYYWLLLFACHGAFIDIVNQKYKDKAAIS